MPSKNKLIFLVIALQVLFFIVWNYFEYNKLHNLSSKKIIVTAKQLDPRNYLSGNYLNLTFEFSNLQNFKNKDEKILTKNEIYAVLRRDGDKYIPDYFSFKKPIIKSDQIALKGQYLNNSSNIIPDILFGIEKYFINENTTEPKEGDIIEAELIIQKDFTARINKLLINGEEWH